jgi:ppGpp synthetase/RelA/SpoT-type nucleotidyltranferase
MVWATPQYSKGAIDWAGRTLANSLASQQELSEALAVINNWRSSHSFPLNTMQVGLRKKARQVDPNALVAQRIKRLSSIEAKLRRFDKMSLSRMQDIGGARAVVSSVAKVRQLVALYRESNHKHKLVRTDDYIENPQASGYRGIHLVYRYFSDRSSTYNGLQIELQLRSPLQHAWATAVETVGTFLKQALKSSQGHAEWLRFFSLMGSAIAIRERGSLVPNTPTNKVELIEELRQAAVTLDVERRLEGYGAALRTLEDPSAAGADFFLLALDPTEGTVTIKGYARAELERATADYLSVERSLEGRPGAEAVLVSVDSIAALQRAYPNYFLDTRAFLKALQQALAP